MNPVHLQRPRLTLVALMTTAAVNAWAQTPPTPNIGDVLQQIPSAPPTTRPSAPLPQVDGIRLEQPLKALPGGPTLKVDEFAFVGNRVVSTEALNAVLEKEKGKTLTLGNLEELAARITNYYREKGYFVARAYVPEQEVVSGTVTFRVVEGSYGRFILENQSLVRDPVLQGMLDDVRRFDIVSLETLERAMLIINDTPGAQVSKAEVMPGKAIGTSDFLVGTVATPAHNGYILADNHGTRFTGKNRLSFNWDANSPFGQGERFSVSGMTSERGGLVNGRVAYSMSLAPNGLRGDVELTKTEYEIDNRYFNTANPPDVYGDSKSLGLGLSYPLVRTKARTIEVTGRYTYRDLQDYILSKGPGGDAQLSSNKHTNSVTAGVNLRDERYLWGLEGVTQGSLSLTLGRLHMDADSLLADQSPGGPDTAGNFSRLNAALSRFSILPNDFTLTGSVRAQWAVNRNLDSSERMGIGGPAGVAAYPSGELSGSDAYLVRVELARNLPMFGKWASQWQLFTDGGRARPLDKVNDVDWRSLSDVGVGLTSRHADGLLVKAQLAHRLTSAAQSEPASRLRLLLQLGWIF